MTNGQEVGHLLQGFETRFLHVSKPIHHHHEYVPSIQSRFAKEDSVVLVAYESKGNPYMEQSDNLITLHTQEIMPPGVVSTIRNIDNLKEEQHGTFFEERVITCSRPITDT